MAKHASRGNQPRLDPLADSMSQALDAHQRGQLDKAERLYAYVLNKNFRHVEALHFSGVLCLQRGHTVKGVEAIQAAVAIEPTAAMRSNLANGLIRLGRYAEALVQLDLSIAGDGNNPAAHTNRGIALVGLNRHQEAMDAHRTALKLQANFVEALNNLGNSQRALGLHEDALSSYARALALQPGYAEALNNRGLALNALGRFDDAIASFDAALARRPKYHEAWNNKGNALRQKGDFVAAHACYDNALALSPNDVDTLYNKAHTYGAENCLDDALQTYQAVLVRASEHVDAHWNTTLIHLLKADFEKAWADYHWRWKTALAESLRHADKPAWTGDEDLQGRSILVWAEQGLGDTLQFCRHAIALHERGAQVWLEVQAPLVDLLRSLSPHISVVARGEVVPVTDYQCSVMDLPGALGITAANIPATIPYLAADLTRKEYWAERLADVRPKIGLVCSGNPKLLNDHHRSIPLQMFAPLVQHAPCCLLQKECRQADVAWLAANPELLDLRVELRDFQDTAAIIASLELVISVDTSVAHLAGALGRPVWLLLPFAPDWRWQLVRDDSPWYPGMRLYRQPRHGDWGCVLQQVVSDLQALQGS
ncbi:tetratricopeptide repeat protein [Uliginosibacterium gangwonense]|uniref:tetratricopeptide repeat protein n=1 Tax=Uliginosibacterium gangwonense TaxID=392736 RepID=UPI00036DA2CE|nr:tetratricopeptide repeat protein [Uliginosibacterium gangwonense]